MGCLKWGVAHRRMLRRGGGERNESDGVNTAGRKSERGGFGKLLDTKSQQVLQPESAEKEQGDSSSVDRTRRMSSQGTERGG